MNGLPQFKKFAIHLCESRTATIIPVIAEIGESADSVFDKPFVNIICLNGIDGIFDFRSFSDKSQYNSTYGTRDVNYVLAGMGRMGLAAAAVFAVLLLLNYLGLSWLTTWIAVIIRYLVNAIL